MPAAAGSNLMLDFVQLKVLRRSYKRQGFDLKSKYRVLVIDTKKAVLLSLKEHLYSVQGIVKITDLIALRIYQEKE